MGVRHHLSNIVKGVASASDETALVRHAHGVAVRYLALKQHKRLLNSALPISSLEDLAWDCIGPIFSRNTSGRYVRFFGYEPFTRIDDLNDEDLDRHLRLFIIQSVNDEWFAMNREADPSLSRYIRNIKAASKQSDHLVQPSINGLRIRFKGMDRTSTIRIPPEFLLTRLCARASGHPDLSFPRLLALTTDILSEQTDYAATCGVTELALIYRELHSLLNQSQQVDEESILMSHERESLIADSINRLRDQYHPKYVGKQKVSPSIFEVYLQAIKDVYHALMDPELDEISYYEVLRAHLPDLTPTQYHTEHRAHFEYLTRLGREQLGKSLKKQITFFGRPNQTQG